MFNHSKLCVCVCVLCIQTFDKTDDNGFCGGFFVL